jgi:cation:H+ antiporter
MSVFDAAQLSLPANILIFLLAAAAIWLAGPQLARAADAIAEHTGIGSALAGLLILSFITALPETAVSVSAGANGNADLAVNNILGSIAFQIVVLAIGDAVLRRRPLTASAPSQMLLLEAVFSAMLLCLVAGAVVVGDVPLLGVGVWSTVLLLAVVGCYAVLSRYQEQAGAALIPEEEGIMPEPQPPIPLSAAGFKVGLMAAVILVAGYALAQTSDALAEQTGIGQSFMGAIFTSTSTSLPEIATVVAAVRLRRYIMAFSNIFGANIFDVGLIFLIDAAYPGGPVLSQVGTFAAFAAMLGAMMTLIYIAGLAERRNRAFIGLGFDSWAVIGVYAAGVAILFSLR